MTFPLRDQPPDSGRLPIKRYHTMARATVQQPVSFAVCAGNYLFRENMPHLRKFVNNVKAALKCSSLILHCTSGTGEFITLR